MDTIKATTRCEQECEVSCSHNSQVTQQCFDRSSFLYRWQCMACHWCGRKCGAFVEHYSVSGDFYLRHACFSGVWARGNYVNGSYLKCNICGQTQLALAVANTSMFMYGVLEIKEDITKHTKMCWTVCTCKGSNYTLGLQPSAS